MPKGCNCASGQCSCQIAGGGNVSIDGVGSESNPYTINVEPTQTDFIDSSTVTWSPVTGQGTDASPFLVTASAAGGIPVGGSTGQHLAKKSNTNFDTQWVASAAALTTFSASGACTVALTVTSTETDVVGMSVPVTVTSTGDVFIVTCDFDVSVVTGPVSGGFIGRLTVGALPNSAYPQALWNIQAGATNSRNIVTQTWRITGLTPGTVIFKGSGSSAVTGFRVNTGHSTITVQQVGVGATAPAPIVDTGWIALGTAEDLIIPNATNATLNGANYRQWGPLLQVRIQFTLKVAVTTPTSGDIANLICGTFLPQFRPGQESAIGSYSVSRGCFWAIGVSGNLTLSAVSGSTNLAIGEIVSAAGQFFIG